MKTVSFKKGIELLGYKVEKYYKGYNFRSAFATKNDGLYYFSIEDIRDDNPSIFRRTAQSLTDYRGGINTYDVIDDLAGLGYQIVEKRGKGDYNSL